MLRYFKYKTPFNRVFKTALGEFRHREGIILVYEEGGIQAFGEVAPLPGFSKEKLADAETVLIQNKNFINSALQENEIDSIIKVLDQIHGFPSLSFGLDTLQHDLKAKRDKKSLGELLFEKVPETVSCNTTIGIKTELETISAIQKKVAEGFETVKIKVGQNFDLEKSILQAIRRDFPKLQIRIDANQAWTADEAISKLNSISNLDIEYCEQPVSAINIKALKKVTENTEIKIAADEAIGNKSMSRQVIEQNCCDLIIIKPALIGLFDNINVTKQLAETHNMEVVFTTLLDGIIGRKITATLASGLGSKKHSHGLSTGALLDEQGITPELIKKGLYVIPNSPGIGNPVNLTLLEEII